MATAPGELGLALPTPALRVDSDRRLLATHRLPAEIADSTELIDVVALEHAEELTRAVGLALEGAPSTTRPIAMRGVPGRLWKWSIGPEPEGTALALAIEVTHEVLAPRNAQADRRALTDITPSVRQLPVMFHSIDGQGHLLHVSDQWLARLGYEASEVLGRPVFDFLTPACRARAEHTFARLLDGQRIWNVPMEFVARDGTTVHTLPSVGSEWSAEGEFVRSAAVLVDITNETYLTKPVDLEQFTHVVQAIDEFWFSVVRLPRA